MNNLLIIIAIVVLFVFFMCNRKENLYGSIVGEKQIVYKDPKDNRVCYTDYNDENCKFVAINCVNNEESLLYDE